MLLLFVTAITVMMRIVTKKVTTTKAAPTARIKDVTKTKDESINEGTTCSSKMLFLKICGALEVVTPIIASDRSERT